MGTLVVAPEILAAIGAVALAVATVAVVWWRRRRARTPPGASGPPGEAARPARATLNQSLTKTREGLLARLQAAFGAGSDAEARLAQIEEVLLTADVGVKATQQLIRTLQSRARQLDSADALRQALREQMVAVLANGSGVTNSVRPFVVLVAGVNGVGKTTTIGKLAHHYKAAGKKVLLVAADTFRAAASEQLQRWAQRVGVECVHHQAGSDPAAVAHDGIAAAVARGVDVVIVDTAGRLHVKQHLIEELKKIVRVIGRQLAGAPHEVLLVIDATTGQNAINQARVFQEALSLTGIVLTKLDGTAKGGAVFAVRAEIGVPIRWIGLGEQAVDLEPFDPEAFVDALLSVEK